jgi:hypothetical protein
MHMMEKGEREACEETEKNKGYKKGGRVESHKDLPVGSAFPLFKIFESRLKYKIVSVASYDREEIPDLSSISGQINCRAELESLPLST